ncbi:hypothetical protein C4579_03540 [Candidatus Microgenomates bacterium]|nr:MAG: hypothetical protein C4579_03540 [Candidatus Microgenomates bacterium]
MSSAGHKKAHLTLSLSSHDLPQVEVGDKIKPDTILITGESSHRDEFNLGKLLEVKGKAMKKYLKVKDGNQVEKGQVLAEKGGLLRSQLIKAPIAGTFHITDLDQGMVAIEQEKQGEEVKSWFSGKVTEVTNDKIVFEVSGQAIEANAGKGQPVSGNLHVISEVIDVLSMPTDLEDVILAVKEIEADIIAKADVLGAVAFISENWTDEAARLPFVTVSDIKTLKSYHGKNVIVYGDEQQLLIVADSDQK